MQRLKTFEADKPCICCNKSGSGLVTYHHLLTQKARPDLKYEKAIMIPVCQQHHNMFHAKGLNYMEDNFPQVKEWLVSNNWYKCELTNKWRLTLSDN